jgi:hypothetical protein
MRGTDTKQSSMLCLMSPETVVPAKHPLRRMKPMADAAMAKLSPMFDAMYSAMGRPSIPPERLLKATLLMALYTVRSERLFCEQLDYNLLFRWSLDMDMTEPSFDHSTFSRNRQRLLDHEVDDPSGGGVQWKDALRPQREAQRPTPLHQHPARTDTRRSRVCGTEWWLRTSTTPGVCMRRTMRPGRGAIATAGLRA